MTHDLTQEPTDGPALGRRAFLRGSAAAALAVAGAGLLDGAPAEAATAGPFPIGAGDHRLVRATGLPYSRSGWQSFAWASKAKTFFYVQPCPSAHRGSGITDAKEHGDLRLSTISAGGHTSSDFMQLTGFGHGGSMGVESSVSHAYIWIGCNASSYRSGHNAESNAIACFRWVGGRRAYTSHQVDALPHSARYVLKHNSTANQVVYDESTHRIALRYTTGSGSYYAVYSVADVRAKGNGARPLAGLDNIPASHVEAGGSGSRQSFALWGDYLYFLRGSKSKNDATLSAYNLRTRKLTHAPFRAAAGSRGREPEGLCIYRGGSTPRLAVGVKNDTSTPHRQTSAVYLKV